MVAYFDRSLTVEQQKTAAAMLSQAFAKDPFMTYLLPDVETRIPQLTKLFLPLIRCSQHFGGVKIPPGGGGILVWIPGSAFAWPVKVLELFRSGLVWLPWSVGLSTLKRLKVHDDVCEQTLLHHAPKNFAYLWVVGVHPDRAGQGLGKQMIRSAMDDMRQRGYSSCWLRTENPKNVGIYEHLGFEQVYVGTPSGSGLQYWLMSQELG